MPFIEGTINSPSVEIRCNTFTEFKQKTFELFATTIYYDGGTYYVFNKEMTIAWYYRIEIDAIHSVWENP